MGSLLYLATWTRPDIACAVGQLSRFMTSPGPAHWTAAKHVLRYLRGTAALGLTYNGSSPDVLSTLQGYADANWGADLENRKSTTGALFMLSSGPIAWQSKLQATVATFTMESEYMALATCVQEGLFIRSLLSDLLPSQSNSAPMSLSVPIADTFSIPIAEDNQSCIAYASNRLLNARSKHIDIRHHFIREHVRSKLVKLTYIDTKDQLADILTKCPPVSVVEKFCNATLGTNLVPTS